MKHFNLRTRDILWMTALAAVVASLTGCYVVPIDPRTGQPATITPLPRPACAWLPWSPKKNWNQGSLARGWRTALLVLMLTTAGEALRAAGAKLPGATSPAGVDGACSSETPALLRIFPR